MLCLYLGFPPSCFFFRCRKNWPPLGPAALPVHSTRPLGRISVSGSPLASLPSNSAGTFPSPYKHSQGLLILRKPHLSSFFLSRVLLVLFIPLIPKLGNCSTACHQVCHMKVFCVSETLSSLSFVMGFPSRSILCPFFSSNLLPWFQCFIPCPHPFSFSASIFSYLLTISTQVSVSAWLKPNLSGTQSKPNTIYWKSFFFFFKPRAPKTIPASSFLLNGTIIFPGSFFLLYLIQQCVYL